MYEQNPAEYLEIDGSITGVAFDGLMSPLATPKSTVTIDLTLVFKRPSDLFLYTIAINGKKELGEGFYRMFVCNYWWWQ